MELSDYLGRIWHWMWLILVIAAVAVIIDVAIVWALPRQYQTTSILEVGGIQSLLGTPGQSQDTRQSLPSAIKASTQTYLSLLQSASVKAEAAKIVRDEQGVSQNSYSQGENGTVQGTGAANPGTDFTYEGTAESVRGGATDIIYIDVNADKPELAKAYADALATVLVEKANNLSGETADEFVRNIQEQQVDPINKRLAEIRAEIEKLKISGASTEQNIKISALQDDAVTLDETRKQYTDAIAKIRLNEALSQNDLRVISMAVLPESKEKPDFLRSGAVAAASGLIIGLIAVIYIERRKTSKDATVF